MMTVEFITKSFIFKITRHLLTFKYNFVNKKIENPKKLKIKGNDFFFLQVIARNIYIK